MRHARVAWAASAVHAASALLAVLSPLDAPHTVVAVSLFAAGVVAFLLAYARAVQRSRTDAIGIGGLYLLLGDTAPRPVARALQAALALQVAVALAASLAEPYTYVATAWLVPMFGLGVMGLYGAAHGRFGPRQ